MKKGTFHCLVKPYGKPAFVQCMISRNGKILDVGCGNSSPKKIKTLRTDLYYVGLDVGLYNQSTDVEKWADKLIITTPEEFHLSIGDYQNSFDSIVCAHNLEHCNYPMKVLDAMSNALKTEGLLYLSFPSEDSVNFPSRKGCLNFYDDLTHKNVLSYADIIKALRENGMTILIAKRRYRPLLLFLIGLFFEPIAQLTKRISPFGGTWALYGFETVIIAKKAQ